MSLKLLFKKIGVTDFTTYKMNFHTKGQNSKVNKKKLFGLNCNNVITTTMFLLLPYSKPGIEKKHY